MLSTIEFQISASRFAAAILSTIRNSPRCLPAAMQGVQLQRIHYQGAMVRNTRDEVFLIQRALGAWDVGLPWVEVEGKQVQLAIDVTLDLATTDHIMANPNILPPPQESLNATIILDLTCGCVGDGRISISYRFSEIEIAAGVTHLDVPLPQWARDQVGSLLNLRPVVIDLTDSTATGQEFRIAGIAADTSGSRLVVRAQVSAVNPWGRWFNFFNGSIDDRLGAHDWSLFLTAADLEMSFRLATDRALQEALGGERYRLTTVGSSFSPGQNRATITITPWLDLPGLGVTAIPLDITLSIDAGGGVLIVDVDARGIRDLISDVKSIAFVVVNLLLPVAGWFVYAALNDAIGDASKVASSAIAGGVQPGSGVLAGAPGGTTIEELPGEPFRYRASIPVATPAFVDGAIEELFATSDGVAIAGRWRVLNFTEGDMQVSSSRFGWAASQVSCGASGERALRDFEEHPERYSYLSAQVDLSTNGSAAARLCSVTILNAPDASSGLNIQWNASDLPTRIVLTAPASYANLSPGGPVNLEIRTTHGVFHTSMAQPAPMTEQDRNLVRSLILLQLDYCDTQVLPPWFVDRGKFDIAWIVDPLIDPDYDHTWVSIAEVTVEGLAADAHVQLLDPGDTVIAEAGVDMEGVATLSMALTGDMQNYALALRGDILQSGEQSITFTQELFESRGSIRVPALARGIFAAPALIGSSFLVALDDRVLHIDATMPSRPVVSDVWNIPGVRGVLADDRGMMTYGGSGLHMLTHGRVEQLRTEPVLDATALPGGIAILSRGQLDFTDRYGATIDVMGIETDESRLIFMGGKLQVHSQDRVDIVDVADTRPIRTLELDRSNLGISVGRSSIDARLYYQRGLADFVSTRQGPRGSMQQTAYTTLPWQTRAARMGDQLLHMGDGVTLNVYRSCGNREAIPYPIES